MEPVRTTIPHVRALDGLRGLAVVGVLLYHGNHLTGGYLGVDLFFVLSGFLITSLLLAEHRGSGRVALGAFWARRARRLLPAAGLLLVGVALYCLVFAEPIELARIRGDALATIGYVANWRAIYAGQSYFELFTSPSPLQHTWSLAIEEQFYVLWPLLFVGLAKLAPRRTPHLVLGAALGLGGVSALMMVLLRDPANLNRAYYGTDTRAYALFAGIAVAAAVAIWGHARDPVTRVAVEVCAAVSVLVLAVMWTRLDAQTERLYVGGFALAGAAAALVILAATNPQRGPIARVLSVAPLCWLGVISYGLYLWHWPVDIVLNADRTGITGWPLFALRTGVAIGIAVLSYRFLELPIRRGAWRIRRPVALIPAMAGAVIAVIFVTTAGAVSAPTRRGTLEDSTRATGISLVGDSIAQSLRPGLERAGIPVHLWWSGGCRMIHGKLPFHPQFSVNCPWEGAFQQVINVWQPRHVLLLIGIWDMFSVTPDGTNATLTPGEPAWNRLFAKQIRAAVAEFRRSGATVTLITLPCTSSMKSLTSTDVGSFDVRRVKAANDVIRSVAREFPQNVDLADMFSVLCPNGKFQVRVRGVQTRSDGVHLSDEGADLVVRALRNQFDFTATARAKP